MNEEWRPVVGSGGLYEVSSLGNVRSFVRSPAPRPMALRLGSNGYPRLVLRLGGKKTTVEVHRLVLAAFVGPCPPAHVTRHLDGDRTNNNLLNLTYGTYSQNARDSIAHGTNYLASRVECLNGHPFEEANTRIEIRKGLPKRVCRACRAARERARRAQRKAMAA